MPDASAAPAVDITDDAIAALLPEGEGGQVAADGLCSVEPHGRTPVAIIGGTGYVGRLLARRLLSHPTFCLGPVVGSKRSEGVLYKDVWVEKEAALMKNYGQDLWTAQPFPEQLEGLVVASLDELLAGSCKIAVSCVAPDVGYIEDILVNGGVKVYSISPYKRSENLTVPEVNPSQIPFALDAGLFKSPNCVSVGTTLALKAVDEAFGIESAGICTFQSLSGRGDAMYPPELVRGNIYPVWGTKEKTEVYIGNEIAALLGLPLDKMSVRAHRVGVHIGHLVDARVRVKSPELLTSVEAVENAFEAFAPLSELYGPQMPSLPKAPLKVIREVGAPRPKSHCMEFGGMQVAVGNIKLEGSAGVWHLCFSLVVNNMIRGAYGAALLMAEYHLYLQQHRHVAKAVLAQHGIPTKQKLDSIGACKADAMLGTALTLPWPSPTARANLLCNEEAVAEARAACTAEPGDYHGALARRHLHWYHPTEQAWLSYEEGPAPGAGRWTGWTEQAKPFTLPDASWCPWSTALDDGRAPFFEWFAGGLTSAECTFPVPSLYLPCTFPVGSRAGSPPPPSTRSTATCSRAMGRSPPSSRSPPPASLPRSPAPRRSPTWPPP
jgi:aspartate-semialdehyde dehydrogenase